MTGGRVADVFHGFADGIGDFFFRCLLCDFEDQKSEDADKGDGDHRQNGFVVEFAGHDKIPFAINNKIRA